MRSCALNSCSNSLSSAESSVDKRLTSLSSPVTVPACGISLLTWPLSTWTSWPICWTSWGAAWRPVCPPLFSLNAPSCLGLGWMTVHLAYQDSLHACRQLLRKQNTSSLLCDIPGTCAPVLHTCSTWWHCWVLSGLWDHCIPLDLCHPYLAHTPSWAWWTNPWTFPHWPEYWPLHPHLPVRQSSPGVSQYRPDQMPSGLPLSSAPPPAPPVASLDPAA